MSIRSILVPVRGDGKGEHVLDHAVMLAKDHNAHIDVFHARAGAKDLVTFGAPLARLLSSEIADVAEKHAEMELERVCTLFQDYCASRALKITDKPSEAGGDVTANWHETEGTQAKVIGQKGKLTDIIFVAKPDESGGMNTFKAALMETGRPVIVVPDKAPKTIAKRIAIGWNGSAEVTGAVVSCRPILEAADHIDILAAGEDDDIDLPASDLARYLCWHGKDSETSRLACKSHDVAKTILAYCRDQQIDLLILGGFGKMHRRELIMGGVTEDILKQMDFPVMFHH